MSAGCKAALARWWEREGQFGPMEADASYARENFIAGFDAALSAMERYRTHLMEQADEFERAGDIGSAWVRRNLAQEIVSSAAAWVRDEFTCGIEEHTKCQEANKR